MRMRISSLKSRPKRRAFCRATAGAIAMSPPEFEISPFYFELVRLRDNLGTRCLAGGSSGVNDNTSVGRFLPRYARFHFAMSVLVTRQIVTASAGIFRSFRNLAENFSRSPIEM